MPTVTESTLRIESTAARYTVAMIAVAVAVGIRALLTPVLEAKIPYATLYFAILLAAWYGGYGPAVVAVFTGAVAAAYFFLPPQESIGVAGVDNQVGLALFLVTGSGIAGLGGLSRAARQRATAASHEAWQQHEQLHTTLHSIGDAVIVTDEQGRVSTFNQVAEELTGWSLADARGRPLEEVFVIHNESTGATVANPVRKVLREGIIVGLANHTVLVARNGATRPIDDSAAPIKDRQGRTTGVVLVFRDVTQQRRDAAILQENIARKTAMFESALDCIITMDHEGNVVEFNPAAEATFGYSREKAVGQRLGELIVPPALRESHFRGLATYLQTGEGPVLGKRLELPAMRADGSEFPIELAILRIAAPGPPLFTAYLRDISQRKVDEETLRSQREQLHVTLSSIGDAVIATNRAGNVTFLNDVARSMTGWTPEEAVGAPLSEVFNIINEHSRQPVENPAMRALKEGAIVGLANHTLLIARDGAERPIDDSAAPIRDAGGNVAGAVLVFRDITERKQAEAALAERMRLLALSADVGAALTEGSNLHDSLGRCALALVEHLDAAFARVWTLDPQENVLRLQASAGLYTHLDGPHGRVPVGEFKIGLIAEERKPHLTNSVIGDPRVPEQAWAKREALVSFAGYPLVVDDRLVGVMAMFGRSALSHHTLDAMAAVADEIALGIDRNRASQALADALDRESERSQRLRQVAAAALTLNSAMGPPSVLGVIDAEAKRIVGANRAEIHLQTDPEPPPGAGLTAALIGRGGRNMGHIRVLDKSSGSFNDDDQAILTQLAHVAAVAYENALLYEELRENDRRKDEFLAMLAHELRNPLAPIRSALELLAPDTDQATAELARGVMQRQVEHIVRLVDDLLDVSRVMQGKIQLRKKPFNLNDAIYHAIEEVTPAIEDHSQRFTLSLPEPPIWVNADTTRLSQVVSNLLTNASKFSDDGGEIWLTVRPLDGDVTIGVRDCGAGLAQDMLKQIFEPFTQVTSSLDRSRGGLGIGLALVRNLVELHGGSVEARSAGLGKGSEFIVQLPRLDGEHDQEIIAMSQTPIAPKRVLVVDDNLNAAQTLSLLLRKIWGHTVAVAHDGIVALEKAGEFKPEVILLDIGLPGLSGYQVAQRIRENPQLSGIWLIALSGYGQEQDLRRSREAGFDNHLVKPVSVSALQTAFERLGNVN